MGVQAHVLANGNNNLPNPNTWFTSSYAGTGVYVITYINGPFNSSGFQADTRGNTAQKTNSNMQEFTIEVRNGSGTLVDDGFGFVIDNPKK